MFGVFGLLMSLRNMLKGSKTYAIAFALLTCVVVEKYLGWDVPGFTLPNDWLTVVLGGLGLASLRAGVADAVTKITNFNKLY
jgi:hypothetical protein